MKGSTRDQTQKSQNDQHGRMWATEVRVRKAEARPSRDQPRASSLRNDNYCVTSSLERLLARSQPTVQRQCKDTCVNLNVVPHVHTAPRHSQGKEKKPGLAGCHFFQKEYRVKYVKSASCVTQLSCVKPVRNVNNVVTTLPVEARLQN